MPKKLTRNHIEPCDRHELEAKAWDWDFSHGVCLRCLKDRVDVLWSIEADRRKKHDSESR